MLPPVYLRPPDARISRRRIRSSSVIWLSPSAPPSSSAAGVVRQPHEPAGPPLDARDFVEYLGCIRVLNHCRFCVGVSKHFASVTHFFRNELTWFAHPRRSSFYF